MFRMISFRSILPCLLVAACASANVSESSTSVTETTNAAALEVVPDVDQEVVSRTFGEVKVHTLVSRADRVGTATHVIEGPTGVVVVDTHLVRRDARALRAFVDAIGKPVERVIISHGHPDHYFGLEYFEDLPTYALPESIADMRRRWRGHRSGHVARIGDAITDYARFPANELAPGGENIGGVEFQFESVVNGEDVTQLVVRLPAQHVLIVQDLSSQGYHPFVGTLRLRAWRDVLSRLIQETHESASETYVLVGHGPPGGAELLEGTRAYLPVAEEVIAAGPATQGEFVDTMKERFPDLEGDLVLPISARFVVSNQ
ncbi:MAG: MBL fold metallo-hydrolase [Polyangiales bacterium]